MPLIDDVLARIRREDLVQFALEICGIDSAIGHEREVGEHLYRWMEREGLHPRKLGLQTHRFNLLGRFDGSGGGFSLIFNSHMDTAVPGAPDLVHADPTERRYHSAWIENDLLIGEGIINDK